MTDQDNTNNSFFEKLQNVLRLVVLDDETLKEVKSFRFSLLNLYFGFISLLFLTALLSISLIIFTPIKRFIPGYGDVNDHPEFMEMSKKVRNLEQEITVQEEYINGFKRMLNNEKPKIDFNQIESITDPSEGSIDQPNSDLSTNFSASNGLEHIFFTAPVNGSISSSYEPHNDHYGVDILAPKESPIKAILGGVVINSSWNLESGNTISIQHQNNLISVFKHNSVLLKKEGDVVDAGEVVAIIGNSGTLSDGPHLHFEMWYDGKSLNPNNYFNFE